MIVNFLSRSPLSASRSSASSPPPQPRSGCSLQRGFLLVEWPFPSGAGFLRRSPSRPPPSSAGRRVFGAGSLFLSGLERAEGGGRSAGGGGRRRRAVWIPGCQFLSLPRCVAVCVTFAHPPSLYPPGYGRKSLVSKLSFKIALPSYYYRPRSSEPCFTALFLKSRPGLLARWPFT